MTTKEMERFKQILPKISARLADKKEPMERLIIKMKELQIFQDNVDIFQTLAEMNNFEILEYLKKEILRIEGFETIVLYIEGKPAQDGDVTENSLSSADNGSDDLESESDPFYRELRQMRQQVMKELQEMKNEIKETRAEAREHNEEAKKRESTLLGLIRKLEKDKDEIIKELEETRPTGIDKTAAQALQHKFHDLETKYNQLLNQMNKMGETEMALRERNKRLEKEIAQLKLALISMQVSKTKKAQMYTKLTAPTGPKKDKK